jgi:hypothetical protein
MPHQFFIELIDYVFQLKSIFETDKNVSDICDKYIDICNIELKNHPYLIIDIYINHENIHEQISIIKCKFIVSLSQFNKLSEYQKNVARQFYLFINSLQDSYKHMKIVYPNAMTVYIK